MERDPVLPPAGVLQNLAETSTLRMRCGPRRVRELLECVHRCAALDLWPVAGAWPSVCLLHSPIQFGLYLGILTTDHTEKDNF
jgi:hypothetical protein